MRLFSDTTAAIALNAFEINDINDYITKDCD